MNSEPQLEVTWDGVLCFENMWVRNSWASSGESMESWVGMKRDCFVRWLTITNIAMCPSDAGSCSIKSIEMDSHGRGGIGSCLRKPYGVGGISVRCKTRLQVPDSRVRAWSQQSYLRRDKIQYFGKVLQNSPLAVHKMQLNRAILTMILPCR